MPITPPYDLRWGGGRFRSEGTKIILEEDKQPVIIVDLDALGGKPLDLEGGGAKAAFCKPICLARLPCVLSEHPWHPTGLFRITPTSDTAIELSQAGRTPTPPLINCSVSVFGAASRFLRGLTSRK